MGLSMPLTPTSINPVSRRAVILGLATAGLASCSALGTFNTLVPGDSGGDRIAEGLAYGELPRQKLDIYAPPGARGLPTVLFIYGGSWNSGSRSEYGFLGQALSSRGFVVAVADYRLVPEVLYPDFLDDGALALKWLRDHAINYGGDPSKLFIMGHSAGAYNAMMVALDQRLTAGVGLRGQVLRGAIGLAGPYDFLPLDVDATRDAFGKWPNLPETQPVNHATRFAPPSFLATGDADDLVFPRNTYALAKKLRAAGRPVEERTYPGVGHVGLLTAFSRPFRDKGPVLDDVARFIKAHAG